MEALTSKYRTKPFTCPESRDQTHSFGHYFPVMGTIPAQLMRTLGIRMIMSANLKMVRVN